MKLITRMKNLWHLSGVEQGPEADMREIKREIQADKPKMAIIIKKEDPIDDLLNG